MPNASLSVSMFAARKQKRSLTQHAHVERLLRWWFFLEISNDSKEEQEEQEDKEEEEEEEEEKVSVIKMIKMKLKNK